MHVVSGDLWAGAEVAVAGLLPGLKPHYDVSAIVFNEGILAQKLREEGVRVYIVKEKGSFRDIPMLTRIERIMRNNKIELLHTHGYKENVLGVLAGKLAGVKRFVTTQHGAPEPFTGFAKLKMEIYLLFERFLSKYVIHMIISVSEDLRSSLIEGYGSEKVVTIHNGIQLPQRPVVNTTEKKRELGILPGMKIVGTVSRLKPIKGINYFLKAAKTVLETHKNIVFLIVGDGPLEDELKDMARALGIHDRVFFLGFQEDVTEMLSIMDVFVLTSLHEGIPVSLLEAMWLGLPVVATRVGGVPEVVEHGRSGLLAPPRDEKAIAKAILAMLSPRAKEIASQAERRVIEEFSIQQMVERTEEVYGQLLRNERRTP